MPQGMPFRLTDYLELVDWTGRQMREDKRGFINTDLPAILDRLRISPAQWFFLTTRLESRFKHLEGTVSAIKKACNDLNRHWVHGITSSRLLFEGA